MTDFLKHGSNNFTHSDHERSTIADANESRSWRIWADMAMILIARARKLHTDDPVAARLKASVYALDTTTLVFSASPQ